jgi:NAD(P)-dependent dehydrogenase (short-subunit alcohol dehydrogenase family)
MSTPQSEQVILITGANRSLGLAILQAIATKLTSATYILSCRLPESGYKAIEDLRGKGITAPIEVLELDVWKDESIFAAVEKVKQSFGKLDSKFLLSIT